MIIYFFQTIFQKPKPTATNGDAVSIDGSDDDLPNIDASAKTAPKGLSIF